MANFRDYLPDLTQGKFRSLPTHTAHTWGVVFFQNEFTKSLVDIWLKLREEPFKGLTSNGNVIEGLYQLEDHAVDFGPIVKAAETASKLLSDEQNTALQYPLNSRNWRSWSNPEIYFSKYGLRLEELNPEQSDALLDIIQLTLSPKGFTKVHNAMRTNKFLGDICHGTGVLNSRSYNFLLFGEPSVNKAWGWNIYGHHLCMNAFLDRGQVHIAPVFIGAEPNKIDEGHDEGIIMMRQEEELGLKLMQSLPASQQAAAQIYQDMHDEKMAPDRWNRADQRQLCGAFQDNRVVPYEGIIVTEMTKDQICTVMAILNEFLVYLPDVSRQKRLEQIQQHLSETYFSWIGGFGESDPFYYRIQSPVIVVEFDHHSGVFLSNKEPQKFHIHTVTRAPNGGDYGNALRKKKDRLE